MIIDATLSCLHTGAEFAKLFKTRYIFVHYLNFNSCFSGECEPVLRVLEQNPWGYMACGFGGKVPLVSPTKSVIALKETFLSI